MLQLITSVFGLATSTNNGAQAQYAALRGEYESQADYARAKSMSYYQAYASGVKALIIAIVAVAAVIGLAVYLGKKK